MALLQLLQLDGKVVHMTDKRWCIQGTSALLDGMRELLLNLAQGKSSAAELQPEASSKAAWVELNECLGQGLRLARTAEGVVIQRWEVAAQEVGAY